MSAIHDLVWPSGRLPELLEELAVRSDLGKRADQPLATPSHANVADAVALDRWVRAASEMLGVEAEATHAPYADASRMLAGMAPAMVALPRTPNAPAGFLALLHGGTRWVTVLTPELTERRVHVKVLRDALCLELEREHDDEIAHMLDAIASRGARRERARSFILQEKLEHASVGPCWQLRLGAGSNFWRQITAAGLHWRFVGLMCAYAASYAVFAGAWATLGSGVLAGRLEPGLLVAWALLLAAQIPLRTTATWLQGSFSIGLAMLLKRRLLAGALRLDPDEVRHMGAGKFFGQVTESEMVEQLALSGGSLALLASMELVFAGWLAAIGAGGGWQLGMLCVWIVFALVLGARLVRCLAAWARERLDLTDDLVESMIGHRTRLAQLPPSQWHEHEDPALARYVHTSKRMDRATAIAVGLVPAGWPIVGLATLVVPFVAGSASPADLAIGIASVLVGYPAFQKLAGSAVQLSEAAIAWRVAAPLFRAATRTLQRGTPGAAAGLARPHATDARDATILEAQSLSFRYPQRADAVLDGCDLTIRHGERVLLEGPSGGGKSTLASILAGLRSPAGGLMLLRGFDHETLGAEGWRRSVVITPQFQDNHIVTGTLAFNLLMGRRWPATLEDLDEARAVCRRLGLGALLDRMPGGILQTVGETGWQLSHGERSRVFIARSLLQRADLSILDESLGALDPESLKLAVQCVLDESNALMVIAHP